jgi:hypothetical protein
MSRRRTFLPTMDYNLVKRLKTLKRLIHDEYICRCWQDEPESLTIHSPHPTLA